MKITIFGATGRTGRLLVERAIRTGNEVTAYARDPRRMTMAHERLHVLRGDVLDAVSVHRALAGTDAILSALGTDAFRPPPVLSLGVRHILDAMEAHGVRRIVVLSAAGALRERAGSFAVDAGVGFFRVVLRGVYREHRAMLEELRKRDLDWIAVRAALLTSGPATGRYRVVPEGLPRRGFRISRADVAEFMFEQLTADEFVRKMPAIAT